MSLNLYTALAQRYPITTPVNSTPPKEVIAAWDKLPFNKRLAEIFSYVALNQTRERQRELRAYLFSQFQERKMILTSGREILSIAKKYFKATHNPETTFAFKLGENQLWLPERYKAALSNQSPFFNRLFSPQGVGTISKDDEYPLEEVDFELFKLLIEVWDGTLNDNGFDEYFEEKKVDIQDAVTFKAYHAILMAHLAILADRFSLPMPGLTQYLLLDYIADLSIENLYTPAILELLAVFRANEMVPLFSKLYQALVNKLLSIYVKGLEDKKECNTLLEDVISTLDSPLPEVCEQIIPILSSDTLTIEEAIQGLVGLEILSVRSTKIEDHILIYLKNFFDSLQVADENNADESAQAKHFIEIIAKLLEHVSVKVYPKIYQRFLFLLLVCYTNLDSLSPEDARTVSELVQKPQLQEIPPELLYHSFIDSAIADLLPGLTELKRFTFVREDMSSQQLSVLPRNLETLELKAHFFEEDALEPLNSTSTLKTLRLWTNNNFNGTTLSFFTNNRGLEILDLRGNNLTDNDLKTLRSFENLKELGLAKNTASQNPFSAQCLSDIAPCTGLVRLDLSASAVGMNLFELAPLKKLQVLILNGLAESQQRVDLFGLNACKELHELSLRNSCHELNPNLVDQVITYTPHLKVLDLGHDATPSLLVDEDIAKLNQLVKLEDLNLDRSRITHGGLNHLIGLPIKNLSLNCCEGINDQVFEILSLFPKLKTLSLVHSAVTDEALEEWAVNHPGVKILNAENEAEINLIRKREGGAYIWADELLEFEAWGAMERGIP